LEKIDEILILKKKNKKILNFKKKKKNYF